MLMTRLQFKRKFLLLNLLFGAYNFFCKFLNAIIYNPVQNNQQMFKGVVSVFLLYLLNYPDMFRHPIAILMGLHVPRKLLQFCLRLSWMWIMVRSVQPVAA
jgi:hypothetical protein